MATRIALGLVLAVGIALLVAWGWAAGLVYAFFALVAALAAWGAGVGGRLTEDVSRRRWADRD